MSGLARASHRALNFQRDLTRTITLTDGRQVKSLHDARTRGVGTDGVDSADLAAVLQ